MDDVVFFKWLIDTKNLSRRSAKDVISRYKRICLMMNCDDLNNVSINQLNKNDSFNEKSMFVKSQLRRSLVLYTEFLKGN